MHEPEPTFDDDGVASWISEVLDEHFPDDAPAEVGDGAGPVDLDLADPFSLDADDGGVPEALDPEPLDPDDALLPPEDADPDPVVLDDLDDEPASLDPVDTDPIDVDSPELDPPELDPAELDPTGEPWPSADSGTGLSAFEVLLDAFGSTLDGLVEVAERLGFADELDLGVDGHTAAVALGEMGIDALVEHGSIDDLEHRLDQGDDVMLTGPDGELLVVVDASDTSVVLEPHGGGPRTEIPVVDLEAAWSASGYEMVIADPPPSSDGGAIRLGGSVVLLQMSLPAEAVR